MSETYFKQISHVFLKKLLLFSTVTIVPLLIILIGKIELTPVVILISLIFIIFTLRVVFLYRKIKILCIAAVQCGFLFNNEIWFRRYPIILGGNSSLEFIFGYFEKIHSGKKFGMFHSYNRYYSGTGACVYTFFEINKTCFDFGGKEAFFNLSKITNFFQLSNRFAYFVDKFLAGGRINYQDAIIDDKYVMGFQYMSPLKKAKFQYMRDYIAKNLLSKIDNLFTDKGYSAVLFFHDKTIVMKKGVIVKIEEIDKALNFLDSLVG